MDVPDHDIISLGAKVIERRYWRGAAMNLYFLTASEEIELRSKVEQNDFVHSCTESYSLPG
jgi:hypothetical protein